ncbi:hypothetical protein B0H19DRAFT_440974 [Mycena capillaripes]|nr:hypothetical protein B0H19DRAFT_440974 [Mycena capillaripes]
MDISRASAPLHLLILPCITPTLEFLVGITSLFPESRELSMEFPGRTVKLCGGLASRFRARSARSGVPVVDDEQWVALGLSDDTVFDNLRPEEISDDEEEKEAPIVVNYSGGFEVGVEGRNSVYELFRWIISGSLLLPPNIEVLRVEIRGTIGMQRGLPFAMQHQALAALSRLCPLLREVQFGLKESNWKRSAGGEVWRLAAGPDRLAVRVVK